MLMHTYNPSTQEAEEEGAVEIQGYLQLHRESEANLDI